MKRVLLLILGIIFLIADGHLGTRSLFGRWKMSWTAQVDVFFQTPVTLGSMVWRSLRGDSDRSALIQSLESQNRALAAKVAALQPFAASSSAHIAEPALKANLSIAGGQWIFLAGSDLGVKESALVLIDGTVLGTVRHVHRSYAEIEILTLRALPYMVQHRQSAKTGMLTIDDNQATVQFPEKIPSIAPLDILLSVPDGALTRIAYPVAIVEEVSTVSAQMSTTVTVRVLARPVVGKEAALILQP